jgi:hypothetical protein
LHRNKTPQPLGEITASFIRLKSIKAVGPPRYFGIICHSLVFATGIGFSILAIGLLDFLFGTIQRSKLLMNVDHSENLMFHNAQAIFLHCYSTRFR